MVLAVSIGNTNVVFGREKDGHIYTERRASNTFDSNKDFEGFLLEQTKKLCINNVDGVIISSVKPPLTPHLESAVKSIFGGYIAVNAGMKMRQNLSRYDTRLIGSDRIAACEAAIRLYGAPVIVFDFGTATTVNAVDAKGFFLGGAILAGVGMGLKALSQDTSQLPLTVPDAPPPLIGADTRECLISGAVHGNAAMVDGMIERIESSLESSLGQKTAVIMTGGNAGLVLPHCRQSIIYDPDLLIKGLFLLFEENKTYNT